MFRLGPVLLAAVATSGALAQDFKLSPDPDTIQARRFAVPPHIDGNVDPQEWSGVGSSSRSLVIGGTNQDSGEKGQVWIGYDDTYVYIAARIFLQNPRRISADEFRDNVSLNGNDRFTIQLDTFGLYTDRNEIGFNANGATFIDVAGGRAAKVEWSGRVEGAAQVTATGWEGEVRVPWALMPMPPAGRRDMKFDFDWYVTATGRNVTSHTNQGDKTRVHTLAGVEVPQVSSRRSLLLLPYAYGGYNDEAGEHIANAGLDFKSAVTADMNLVGTINPDFRNIEGDVLNLDFSNFERLGRETRPFFQEGSDYYMFGMGRRIFASQRISEFDMGANVYGNLGGNMRLGVLSTADFENQSTVAGSLTYNPDARWEYTAAFASLQRTDEDNFAGRLNISRRFGNWMGYVDGSITNDQILGKGSATSFGTFYNVPGWQGSLNFVEVTDDYFPRIGFAAERDLRGVSARLEREWEYADGPVNSSNLEVRFTDYSRRDGSHYRDGIDASYGTDFASLLSISAGIHYEHFENDHNRLYRFEVQYPDNNPYRSSGIEVATGDVQGKRYQSVELGLRYRPVQRLQLGLSAQTVKHFEDEDQIVMSFNWLMNKYESIGGRVVYDDHTWNWYASYRMGGNEGAEYFLIVGDPNASSFQKALVLKVTVPLAIRW